MKKYLLILTLLLTAFHFSSCVTDDEEEDKGTELNIGDSIPSFTVSLNNRKTVSSNDLLGNVSLIVFFHTACKDCQQELPIIQQFHDAYPEYPLLCISRAENETSVAAYWEQHQLSLPYSAQDDRTLYNQFARQGIPRIFIVDTTGIIRYIYTDNPLATLEDLERAVQSIDTEQGI